MNENKNKQEMHTSSFNDAIPDIDIVDLEEDDSISEQPAEENTVPGAASTDIPDENNTSEQAEAEEHSSSSSILHKLMNIHTLFFVVVILIAGILIFRLTHWGVQIDLQEIFKDGQGSYDDSLDEILPLIDENGDIVVNDASTIVVFGNAPFADDRDSEDNLANMIADLTGATVYNCSVSGSYLAAQSYAFDETIAPMDAYCLYWLSNLAAGRPVDDYYNKALQALGDKAPAEAEEVYETLTTLDFNTVDVIAIMYDATDYLMGNPMYSDENPTDTLQFTGNLEASIEVFQDVYPNIRIIVMSPTYAYAIDEDGNYVSSDMYTYGDRDVLSTYVIKEYGSCSKHSVSFLDNLYGTITEDNAKQYLTDNLHLNTDGRRLVAQRFEYFLNYYSKGYADQEK